MSEQREWQTLVPRPSPEFPRKFFGDDINLSDWSALEPLAKELIDRELKTPKDLAVWMSDFMQFENAVLEEGARLYINMTTDTGDQERDKAYVHFVEKVEPELKKTDHRINEKLISHPLKSKLKKEEYGRWLASLKTRLELFDKRNLPLQSEITKLVQNYQKICGAMTVEWEGKTTTLSQLSKVLQEPDRDRREKAWREIATRFQNDGEELDKVFNRLFSLRGKVSDNLLLDDYRSYCFKNYERTDYSVEDCLKFHETVEKVVVPVYKEMQAKRKSLLSLEKLRPWDLNCDVNGRPPLKPFQSSQELIEGVDTILGKMDKEILACFRAMREKGLLDLENRVGKAPGGYQCSLDEVRYPFIFMNAVGSNQDVFTLLHEVGHAFHLFLTRKRPLAYNRDAPTEFSEVASMGMERLGIVHLDTFYSAEDQVRAIMLEDEEVFRLLAWVAVIDSFQHWIYTNPNHTGEERKECWMELNERFGCGVDWTGLEEHQASSWHRQPHLFEHPFYYIEYGIAQLGALQIWERSIEDASGALEQYKAALKCGGTMGAKQLFQQAGLNFDFSPAAVEPLITKVYRVWEDMSELNGSPSPE
ncbi:M3 family oligoendopeptidase [Fibrobacterota bacterium]